MHLRNFVIAVCLLVSVCWFCVKFQNHDYTVAIKCITKKNLAKSQNLLSKEIKILQVQLLPLHSLKIVIWRFEICDSNTHLVTWWYLPAFDYLWSLLHDAAQSIVVPQ